MFENVVAGGAFVVIFASISGFFVFQNVKMSQKRSDLEGTLQELQAQASELARQKEQLEGDITEIQTEEYQEKVLREQGLYKKEGEQVVTVLPAEATTETVPVKEEKDRKWWNPFTW